MNICEIAANNSTLNDFDCPGWQIAKAYGDRVFHDVETGQKSWEELPVNIRADTFLHAKDTVTMKLKKVAAEIDWLIDLLNITFCNRKRILPICGFSSLGCKTLPSWIC